MSLFAPHRFPVFPNLAEAALFLNDHLDFLDSYWLLTRRKAFAISIEQSTSRQSLRPDKLTDSPYEVVFSGRAHDSRTLFASIFDTLSETHCGCDELWLYMVVIVVRC